MLVSRTLTIAVLLLPVMLLVGFLTGDDREGETAPPAQVTVVDVAHGVDPRELSNLVRLAADERVIAVDDRPVVSDLAAGAAIADRGLASGTYLDLTVGSARGERRVLVLLH